MSKFKIGQKVKVKQLEEGLRYSSSDQPDYNPFCNNEMAELSGRIATIISVDKYFDKRCIYRLDICESSWSYTDTMLSVVPIKYLNKALS